MQPVLFQYLNLRKKRDGFVPGPTPAECATGPPNWRSSRCWCERHARPKRFRAKPVPDLIRDGYRFAVGKRVKRESRAPVRFHLTGKGSSPNARLPMPMPAYPQAGIIRCTAQGMLTSVRIRERQQRQKTGDDDENVRPVRTIMNLSPKAQFLPVYGETTAPTTFDRRAGPARGPRSPPSGSDPAIVRGNYETAMTVHAIRASP
jgi:hypothetical protein